MLGTGIGCQVLWLPPNYFATTPIFVCVQHNYLITVTIVPQTIKVFNHEWKDRGKKIT